MKDYDEVDPEQYERMYEVVPRENYMKEHWRPLIEESIEKYCRGKEILDLGCGYRRYTTIIKECTENVLGLDISKEWLKHLKNKNNISNVIRADAHSIPAKDASFDVIVTIGLFEYVKREIVIKEMNRILKPRCMYIIQVPNKCSAFRLIGKLSCKVFGREYCPNEPSKKEMFKLFKDNGFELIEYKMDDGLIGLPDFLDRLCGKTLYWLIEKFFGLSKVNPFSNNMFFVVKRGKEGI